MISALTAAVDDLLIGKHGSESRTPVDRNFIKVGKSFFVELHKNPLSPFVIVDIGGVDLTIPVVAETEGFDLFTEVVDIFLSGDRRMSTGIDSVLFSGQTESIPPHRVKDVETLHAFVAADDIGGGISFGVTDMESGAGGIGEHIQAVIFGFVNKVFGAEGFVILPETLPFFLDRREIVLRIHKNFSVFLCILYILF